MGLNLIQPRNWLKVETSRGDEQRMKALGVSNVKLQRYEIKSSVFHLVLDSFVLQKIMILIFLEFMLWNLKNRFIM